MVATFAEAVVTAHGAAVGSATGSTGRLVRDALRRQYESAEYFWKVSRNEVFDRYSDAFKTNVRVRLMHAQVRRGLRQRWGDEHFSQHGNPISNTDMAAGATGFGLSSLVADVAKGARYSEEDLDAAVQYWSYIGYVFGVEEEILPTTARQAGELLDYVVANAGGSTPWSDEISEALVDFMRLMIVPSGAGNGFIERVGMLAVCAVVDHAVGDPLASAFLAAPAFRGGWSGLLRSR